MLFKYKSCQRHNFRVISRDWPFCSGSTQHPAPSTQPIAWRTGELTSWASSLPYAVTHSVCPSYTVLAAGQITTCFCPSECMCVSGEGLQAVQQAVEAVLQVQTEYAKDGRLCCYVVLDSLDCMLQHTKLSKVTQMQHFLRLEPSRVLVGHGPATVYWRMQVLLFLEDICSHACISSICAGLHQVGHTMQINANIALLTVPDLASSLQLTSFPVLSTLVAHTITVPRLPIGWHSWVQPTCRLI